MSATEILAILALVAWSVYRQTRTSQVTTKSRFKMAIIYTIVGLCVGGFDRPSGLIGYGMIAHRARAQPGRWPGAWPADPGLG